jgi:hypothetical protein
MLEAVMKEMNLLDKPGSIFSSDESSDRFINKPGKTEATKGTKEFTF